MRLDDLGIGDAGTAFQGVDVLCETGVEQGVRGEEADEGVSKCGSEFTWVELLCEGINCASWGDVTERFFLQ